MPPHSWRRQVSCTKSVNSKDRPSGCSGRLPVLRGSTRGAYVKFPSRRIRIFPLYKPSLLTLMPLTSVDVHQRSGLLSASMKAHRAEQARQGKS